MAQGVVQSTGEKLGCPIVATDIDAVHRVPAKDGTLYDSVLEQKGQPGPVDNCCDAEAGRCRPVPCSYNDHLTSENQRLFAQALTLSQDPKFAPTSAQLGLAHLGYLHLGSSGPLTYLFFS